MCTFFHIGVDYSEEEAITFKMYNQPAVLKPP